ncbi:MULTISPECIES: hypothetical protein [unclassified Herbaspirillum]|uniref:phage terminase large subunit family protein n=1 Tax=unclassified Herbaspirillum TaxID=2624150 RepID=UPI001E629BE7|nr:MULTISPECIES: hypothetical protein [unclassified Herbaspirillum]
MVIKAKNIIRSGRLRFDAGRTDIAQSFMAIRKILTPSGRAVTYDACRRNYLRPCPTTPVDSAM